MTRMTRMTRMAHTVVRMARWLADLADPSKDVAYAHNTESGCNKSSAQVSKAKPTYLLELLQLNSTM